MLVLWGLVLALAVDVSGRAHVLPNGQVVEVVDEYAKVRESMDPAVRRKKRMLKNKSKLWTGAAVPYEFSKSVWTSPKREYETMIEAMEEIMQETCLRFKERSGEEDFVHIDFQGTRDSHMSYDGRWGGKQPISLVHREYEKPAFLHEMGHTIGLKHEHQRPDRDHYIEILYKNLKPGVLEYFEKFDIHKINLFGEPFDVDSIMMYHDTMCSRNPEELKTIKSKWGRSLSRTTKGQLNSKFSAGDLKRVRELYRCEGDGKTQKPRFPFDIVCSFNDHDCNFKGLRSAWSWIEKKFTYSHSKRDYESGGGYLAWSWKTGTKTSVEDYAWSVGFYGLSPLDKVRGPNGKGCVTFKYSFETQRKGFFTLKLMQVKLHSPVRLDAISSSEIWSEVARYRWINVGRRKQRAWEQVSVLLDVSSPFLLEFVSSVEGGVGEYSVKIDDFELQYTPCLSEKDPKVDRGGNTSPFGWVKRSLSASSGWCPKSLFRSSKSKSSTRSNSRSFVSSSSKSSPGSASNNSLGSNKT